MIRVGVLGATGYMGGEVVRAVHNHPRAELAWATSRKPAPIAHYHPNLYGLDIGLIHPDDISACDLVFMALPTAASLAMAAELLDMGCRVIDLGAAFRLHSRQTWERVYAQPHDQWPLAEQAVYGISELHLDHIKQAQLVANPGCFSSAAILGLAPVLKAGLVDTETLVVNGLSGTAGMGAELSRAAHHPEIGNNLIPYNVVDHRHSYEMEQELGLLSTGDVRVHFTPTYVPITRGILNVCSAFTRSPVRREELLALYSGFYQDHPFIRIYDVAKQAGESWQYRPYPWVSSVSGTNYCYIGLDVDEQRGRIVIFSVLDSLGKGGALAGIENMNLMFGFDREMGLQQWACHPN